MKETYTASVRIQDLPRDVDHGLNRIAAHTNRLKWEVVRDALIEYEAKYRIVEVSKSA